MNNNRRGTCNRAYAPDNDLYSGSRNIGFHIDQMVLHPYGFVDGIRYSGSLEAAVSDIVFIRSIWPDMTKAGSEISTSEKNKLVQQYLAGEILISLYRKLFHGLHLNSIRRRFRALAL